MALVPGNSLQIDIFVTNVPKDTKPKTSPGSDSKPPRLSWAPPNRPGGLDAAASSMEDVSIDGHSRIGIQVVSPEEKSRRPPSIMSFDDDRNSLLMPNPYDGSVGGRYGDGGLKGKDHDYELGLGGGHHQEDTMYDVLDYTHFNGDLDAAPVPAEESFSRRLRQEGAIRRKMTRKMTLGKMDQEALWADVGQQVGSPTVVGTPHTPLPSPYSELGHGKSEHGHSSTLPPDGGGDHHPAKDTRRLSVPTSTSKSRDKRLDRMSMSSIRDSVMDLSTVQELLPKTGKGARDEEVALEFNDDELEDMLAMTEYAWPGRPKLDKLLAEEVGIAKGALVVACCGPTQLSASIRKMVAAQINPAKIKKGDMTGYIACVTEEFEY